MGFESSPEDTEVVVESNGLLSAELGCLRQAPATAAGSAKRKEKGSKHLLSVKCD